APAEAAGEGFALIYPALVGSAHDHAHPHDHARPHAKPAPARGAGDEGARAAPAAKHDHEHHLRETPLRRLVLAFVITAAFMVVEAGVGWWSQSLALVADAGHMLADAAALLLAILAQRIATQTRTRAQTYGFRRAEVLAAFANGVALAL